MSFDAIHKLVEDQIYGSIAMHDITVMDDDRNCCVPFICCTSKPDSAHYTEIISAIGHYLVQQKIVSDYETWKCIVTFMIDDGSAKTKTFTNLNIRFIICAFHLLKAMFNWIDKSSNKNRHQIPETELGKVKGKIYSMLTSVTEEQYLKHYEKLETIYPIFVDVYFRSEWHQPKHGSDVPFYFHWTSIRRRNCYGLWYTNNLLENVYRKQH
jgi:hypothetical protein